MTKGTVTPNYLFSSRQRLERPAHKNSVVFFEFPFIAY